MNATDLMIGDWIRVSSNDSINNDIRGRAVQVLGLREEDAEIRVDLCGHDEYSDFWSDDEDDFEPIPLTPEILEKNGWHIPKHKIWYQNDDVTFYMCRYTDGTYEIYTDGESEYSNLCNIRFVHELQHALRLCRIDKEIKL